MTSPILVEKTKVFIILFLSLFILQCNEVDELIYGEEPETEQTPPANEGTEVAFVPGDVSGMLMWLDASDSDSLFQDSGCSTPAASNSDPIGCWLDKSGNNKNATQSETSRRPELVASAQNNLDAIYFAKTNQQTLDIVSANWQPNQNFTAFIVYFQDTDNGLGVIMSTYPTAAEDFMITSSSTGNRYKYYDRNNWRFSSYYSSGDWIFETHHRTGNSLTLYHNGVLDSQFQNLNTASAGPARLGSYINTSFSNLYKGHIAEIVWFADSLSESDRLKMEGYLAHKWGRAFQLDNTHPYKDNAPTTFVSAQ